MLFSLVALQNTKEALDWRGGSAGGYWEGKINPHIISVRHVYHRSASHVCVKSCAWKDMLWGYEGYRWVVHSSRKNKESVRMYVS
jgi:hypothetical protein